MRVLFALFFICAVAQCQRIGNLKTLKLVSEWRDLEYAFPSERLRQSALRSQLYVPGNGVPIDVDVDYRDIGSRIFVTIPRFTTGIPVTFGVVSNAGATGGPIVQAYPDYSWHSSHGQNCDGITSVFRVTIDECRRLWILDTGRIGSTQYCAPQILVFNLDTDTLVHRYRFPDGQYRPGTSNFITIVLDVRDPPPVGTCTNTVAYIADVTGYGILVYEARSNRSWRVENKLTFPYPEWGTITVAGESFDLMDGILGLALSPRTDTRGKTFGALTNFYLPPNPYEYYEYLNRPSDRTLYFHALASASENSVPLSVLNNRTMWEANVNSNPRAFTQIGVRTTQSAAEAMDSQGNLFFGLMNPIGVACWDSHMPYSPENIHVIAQNDATLQFSSGVKIIRNRKQKEELWVLTCRFQKVMTGTINRNEVNFRIQALAIDELLDGQRCGANSGGISSGHNYNRG